MIIQFSSVQFSCSVMSDSLHSHEMQHTRPPCPSPTPRVYLNPRLLSRWCHLTISSSVVPFLLPSIFPHIRVFSYESALHIRWLKYYSFSFNISHSDEHPGLISFRMDWLDLLAVQRTLKSLLQHKASILRHSAFFIVQLSHPCITTGKTIALTRWTFVGKVMSLLFYMLSRLVMEKAMATHSSNLAWKLPWTEEPGRLQSMGSRRVWQDRATSLSLFTFMHWRRKWKPTPVFLPGESQGWGSLVGCRLWGRTKSDTTETT